MTGAEVALLLELAKLGAACVRRWRESRGDDPDADISAEDVMRIRIRGVDELLEAGRAKARGEEEP